MISPMSRFPAVLSSHAEQRKTNPLKLKKSTTDSRSLLFQQKKVYQNTNHVNRKNNYKKCSICSKLCLNIAQHIKGVHKIGGDDSLYMEYIKNSKVVPKLLTKIEYGKPVELDGSELREAKLKHGKKLANESNTLAALKNLREEMGNLKTKLQEAKNKEEYDISKKLLNEVEARYKTIRYKDTRNYSENVFKWKNEFVKFLAMRDYENPERGARMAVDVMLPFEKETGKPLSFQDLLNSGIVRSMLHSFKLHEAITSTSKIKYLKMFELMVRYLICDCLSPEKKMDETAEDLLIRKIRLDEDLHEIEAVYASLRKKKGEDLVATRKRAKGRLVGENELNSILLEAQEFLKDVSNKTAQDLSSYDEKKVLDVRNNLMVVGSIRLGRRSKELMTMTLEEVAEAEKTLINGEAFHIVKVMDQKNLKHGEVAPIVYSSTEYKALELYIRHLRPKLTNDVFNQSVFIPRLKLKCSGTQDLSFSSAFNILQKFKTESGKKLSSRAIRGSKITITREAGVTDEERRNLARSMSHSVETAERYYNFSELSNRSPNRYQSCRNKTHCTIQLKVHPFIRLTVVINQ